jgi:alanyl-tRNA synthetase
VVPSNEWRGYVLRKIMRRAMRHGKRLGMTEPFLHTFVDTLVAEFGGAYPELVSGRSVIVQVIKSEEERFDAVLTEGLPRLEEVLDRAAATGGVVPGESAFRLYDTFGLPQEFIEDMIDDRRLAFDRDGFNRAMEHQRQTARAKSAFRTTEKADWLIGAGGLDSGPLTSSKDTFTGYDSVRADTTVLALFNAGREQVASLAAGEAGYVVLKETTFYLEAGGQVSDRGTIAGVRGAARVEGLERMSSPEWPRAHRVVVETGVLRPGDTVTASVDVPLRDATRRNHTATHLLHAALRQVLGPHVKQAGSLVAPDRLRFDFVHFNPLTTDERSRIEQIVNEEILKNTPVRTDVRNTEEAIAAGAMALFGEKYGDSVRVVSVPGFSVELCGGTHVRATGDIGLFAIVSESGVAAGVRRIEAITGMASLKTLQWNREIVGSLSQALNARPEELVAKVEAIADDNRRLARDLQQSRMKAVMSGTPAQEDVTEVAGVKLIAREVREMDKDGLRALVDQHRARLESGVVVLASLANGKVIVVVGVTPDLTKKVPAGQVVKQLAPIVGGGGGGRADFAEAGGREPSKIPELLAASRDVVEKLLSG